MMTESENPAAGRWQKLFYAAVALLAIWVGVWGFLLPERVEKALPWPVPALHARFLGAMYLSGTTFMLGALLARRWAAVRIVVPMLAIWTGMLFVVSLFHLSTFDWGRPQTWVWFSAYLAYPLIALWIIWRMRHGRPSGGEPLPPVLRGYLVGQGVIVTLLALLLFLLPGMMVEVWPWRISRLLAQLYSAPFFSYGIGSLIAARRNRREETGIILVATLVFAGGVLLASWLHRSLFSAGDVADWLWFLGFGIATVALGLGSALVLFRRLLVRPTSLAFADDRGGPSR